MLPRPFVDGDLVDSPTAENIAFNLTTLISGLWMRAALQPEPMTSQEAIAHLDFALDTLFRGETVDATQRRAAQDKIATISSILFRR